MVRLTEKYKIGVLCGDLRSVYLALEFQRLGFEVYAYGLVEDEAVFINNICKSPYEVIGVCDVLILPLPATRDNVYIYSKSPDIKIKLSELTESRFGSKIIFGGMIPKYFYDLCERNDHSAFDYYKSEDLIFKNATATAEGAVMLAMTNTHSTISESTLGVIGYGRIGSQLALILKKLGADVTVFARNEIALADAESKGCNIFKITELTGNEYLDGFAKKLDECSVIFNTVPSLIITEDIIKRLSLGQTYIELASSPGGIDLESARQLKLKNIYAPSLPGRYAPKSAGKYVFDEIIKVLNNLDYSERREI